LVILHEEAEDGNAMPDLGPPVMTVKTAVENLVRVCIQSKSSQGMYSIKSSHGMYSIKSSHGMYSIKI